MGTAIQGSFDIVEVGTAVTRKDLASVYLAGSFAKLEK